MHLKWRSPTTDIISVHVGRCLGPTIIVSTLVSTDILRAYDLAADGFVRHNKHAPSNVNAKELLS